MPRRCRPARARTFAVTSPISPCATPSPPSTRAALPARGATPKLLYDIPLDLAAQHYRPREAEPEAHAALRAHIATLWQGDAARVVRCRACGLGFSDPFVAGDHRFFDLVFEPSYAYPQARWEFGRTREVLDALWGTPWTGRRLLEVGGGDGAFLRTVLGDRIAPEAVTAFEYSPGARAQLSALGVDALDQDLRAAPSAHDARYDAVVMHQGIMNFDRLDDVMAALRRVTRADARVFVSTPGGGRIAFNEQNGSQFDLPPMHASRWSAGAFDALGARHGFALVRHELEPEPWTNRVREYATYRYLNRRMIPGTVENRAERVGRGPLRKALRVALAASNLVRCFPTVVRMARRRDIGATQWIEWRREGVEMVGL